MPSPSRWWYGVAAFPLVVVTALLSRFAVRRFVQLAAGPGGDANVGPALASFALSFVSNLLGVLVALVVLVCLVLDVRAVRGAASDGGDEDAAVDTVTDIHAAADTAAPHPDTDGWTPTWVWTLAGVVHLVAALFAPLLALSVPALSAYVYRRYRDESGVD